ncbi:MAG: hypothetical protein ACOC97_02340 [Myxococcota bacterium]
MSNDRPCIHDRPRLPALHEIPLGIDVDEPASAAGEAMKALGWKAAEQALQGAARLTAGTAGAVLGGLGKGVGGFADAYEIIRHFIDLAENGDARAVLRLALADFEVGGGTGQPTTRSLKESEGAAAALLGLSHEEAGRLGHEVSSRWFSAGYEAVMDLRERDPESYRKAAAGYREVHRQWELGIAAAIEGWPPDASLGPTFEKARSLALGWLQQHPEEAGRIRQVALAHKHEGVAAALDGRADEARIRDDRHYRSGVQYGRRVLEEGDPEAIEALRREVEERAAVDRARSCTHGPA